MSVMDKDDAEVLEGLSSQLAMRTLPRLGTLYSALIAAAITAVIVVVTPAAGIAGSLVIWYLMYMLVQTVWSFRVEGRRFAVDRLATTLVWTAFLIALTALVWILVSVTIRGLSAFSWDFLTGTMRNVSPSAITSTSSPSTNPNRCRNSAGMVT